ncbi:translation initiation factor IF-2-like [Mercenaria mercenaria]|uniref:translation initiation factor IF-2-like n=1 Tax=Mercenaria mercenaria TaxID=6596 RepID=UPI00234E4009|nr:translation initiation factor IF-2-like [Mercenaria mercenaria]
MRNCFYFSVYPEDYARLIKPEPWDSGIAMEARRLMMSWAEKQEDSMTMRDKLRTGWKVGIKARSDREQAEKEKAEKEKAKKQKLETLKEYKIPMKSKEVKEVKVDENKLGIDIDELFTTSPLDLSMHKDSKDNLEKNTMPQLSESDTDLEDEVEVKRFKESPKSLKLVKTEGGIRRLVVTKEKPETDDKPLEDKENQTVEKSKESLESRKTDIRSPKPKTLNIDSQKKTFDKQSKLVPIETEAKVQNSGETLNLLNHECNVKVTQDQDITVEEMSKLDTDKDNERASDVNVDTENIERNVSD